MAHLGSTTPRINNFTGAAAARRQKVEEREENQRKNAAIPVFMFRGFGFRPYYGQMRGNLGIIGPFCPSKRMDRDCFNDLESTCDDDTTGKCLVCDKSYDFKMKKSELRRLAFEDYKGMKRYQESEGKVVTLDVPFEAIKDKAKNETREIKINWSQKDGRNQAVIYLVDTKAGGKKAQIFVDFDREEVRHDAGGQKPGELVARVKAKFPETTHTLDYKTSK